MFVKVIFVLCHSFSDHPIGTVELKWRIGVKVEDVELLVSLMSSDIRQLRSACDDD